MKYIIYLQLVFLVSCSTYQVLKDPGHPVHPKYGPIDYDTNKTGELCYEISSLDSDNRKRRYHSYKKMYESCKGPYKVLEEGERNAGGVGTFLFIYYFWGQNTKYCYKYKCMERKS